MVLILCPHPRCRTYTIYTILLYFRSIHHELNLEFTDLISIDLTGAFELSKASLF